MITSSVHGWKCLCAALFTFHFSLFTSAQGVTSPNGKLSTKAEGTTLVINYEGKKALQMEELPFANSDFSFVRNVKEDYRMLTGKRLVCSNEGNEYIAALGEGVKMVLRLYNDGIAFRYEYPEAWTGSDPTVYRIPEGTRRWMQQWTDSYEGYFPLSTTYKVEPVPSFSGISKSEEGYNNRWGYPALLEPQDGLFVLLSEANIEHGQSASCLYNDKELYKVVPADRTKGQSLLCEIRLGAWRSLAVWATWWSQRLSPMSAIHVR